MKCISLLDNKRNHNTICSIYPKAKLNRQLFSFSNTRASRVFWGYACRYLGILKMFTIQWIKVFPYYCWQLF